MYADWTRRYDDGTPHTKHVLTNPIVTVSRDHGGGALVLHRVPADRGAGLQPIIAGRYRDDFALVDGRWRFVNKHIITDLVGDLSQHLLQSL